MCSRKASESESKRQIETNTEKRQDKAAATGDTGRQTRSRSVAFSRGWRSTLYAITMTTLEVCSGTVLVVVAATAAGGRRQIDAIRRTPSSRPKSSWTIHLEHERNLPHPFVFVRVLPCFLSVYIPFTITPQPPILPALFPAFLQIIFGAIISTISSRKYPANRLPSSILPTGLRRKNKSL